MTTEPAETPEVWTDVPDDAPPYAAPSPVVSVTEPAETAGPHEHDWRDVPSPWMHVQQCDGCGGTRAGDLAAAPVPAVPAEPGEALRGRWVQVTERGTHMWVNEDGEHRPVDRTELGYTRRVCLTCRCDWPCPDYAQAVEKKVARDPEPDFSTPTVPASLAETREAAASWIGGAAWCDTCQDWHRPGHHAPLRERIFQAIAQALGGGEHSYHTADRVADAATAAALSAPPAPTEGQR